MVRLSTVLVKNKELTEQIILDVCICDSWRLTYCRQFMVVEAIHLELLKACVHVVEVTKKKYHVENVPTFQ